MDQNPALQIDWESGEGRLQLGDDFAKAPLHFRRDVLVDWKGEIEHLLGAVEADLHPQKRLEQASQQRIQNRRRRSICERLTGRTIRVAEPLDNGDVLLHLGDGTAVVIYAHHEDVKLQNVEDIGQVRRPAAQANTGDYYLREDPI